MLVPLSVTVELPAVNAAGAKVPPTPITAAPAAVSVPTFTVPVTARVPVLTVTVPVPPIELALSVCAATAKTPGFVTVTPAAVRVLEVTVLVPPVTLSVAKVRPLTLPVLLNVTVPPLAPKVVGVKFPPTVVVPLVAV